MYWTENHEPALQFVVQQPSVEGNMSVRRYGFDSRRLTCCRVLSPKPDAYLALSRISASKKSTPSCHSLRVNVYELSVVFRRSLMLNRVRHDGVGPAK